MDFLVGGRTRDFEANNNYPYESSSTSSVSESTMWYPAAGNQLSNEVEEPNQLGLKKPKNQAMPIPATALTLLISIVPLFIAVHYF